MGILKRGYRERDILKRKKKRGVKRKGQSVTKEMGA